MLFAISWQLFLLLFFHTVFFSWTDILFCTVSKFHHDSVSISFGEQVKVVLRVNPSLSESQGQPPVLRIDPSKKRVTIVEPVTKSHQRATMTLGRDGKSQLKTFTFDSAYPQESSQVWLCCKAFKYDFSCFYGDQVGRQWIVQHYMYTAHIPSSLSYTVSSLSLSDDLKTDRPWIATIITQSINYIQLYPSSAYSIWAQGNQSASPFCFALALYRARFFTSCSLSFVLSTRPRCVQASWLMSSAVCSAAAMPVSWAWVVLMWVSNRSLWEAMG